MSAPKMAASERCLAMVQRSDRFMATRCNRRGGITGYCSTHSLAGEARRRDAAHKRWVEKMSAAERVADGRRNRAAIAALFGDDINEARAAKAALDRERKG